MNKNHNHHQISWCCNLLNTKRLQHISLNYSHDCHMYVVVDWGSHLHFLIITLCRLNVTKLTFRVYGHLHTKLSCWMVSFSKDAVKNNRLAKHDILKPLLLILLTYKVCIRILLVSFQTSFSNFNLQLWLKGQILIWNRR